MGRREGNNILLYGAGFVNLTIEHEHCKEGTNVERLVFHLTIPIRFYRSDSSNVSDDGQQAICYRDHLLIF